MHQPPRADEPRESPRHGFQGDRGAPSPPRSGPSALTITISREAGARGGTIARRVGRKLGWQVYDQELLEYMAQEAIVSQGVLDAPPAAPADWVEARLQQLIRDNALSEHPNVVNLARVMLALAAQGQVVLLGRGAACILPHETTLAVRIIAPLSERIAYMAQWLRLTIEEAAERVRLRDERRREFVANNFRRDPSEVHNYDVILNSSQLGEDVCAELIVQAARARAAQLALSPS
ncbi:MAG TPA: cytidylate kinase-like family protein [Gemmataceae bacterium]|nr:cytidylate kinase-like family protein [Gemmataceae bacterium]